MVPRRAGRLVPILCALVIGAWAQGDPLPWEEEKLHAKHIEQRHDGFWVAEQMQLTIANPMHGTFYCEKDDPVPIHVLFNRDVIPEGGHGLITIEDRILGKVMPTVGREFKMFVDDLTFGSYEVRATVYDKDGTRTNITQGVIFDVSNQRVCNTEHDVSESCISSHLPGRTRVSGTGIYAAAAGIESVFRITPVATDGGLILHQHVCGSNHDITVTMMPAPLSNKMEANDDGSFTIRFTPEHAGWYRIDIKVGKIGEEEHIDGSPFQIQVDPLHKVDVQYPFEVEEWGEKGRLMHTERTPGMHVISETDGSPLVKGGSDAEIDKICEGGKGGKKGGCAYATLITDDSYLTGALTLLFSVRRTGCKLPFVAMVAADRFVSRHTKESLRSAGMLIYEVPRTNKDDISDMSEPRWNDNYTKLHLWMLPFSKIIFMDSDMVVLQPIRHLFAIEDGFSAVPDAFHPCYLNTGFMVITPSEEVAEELMGLIDAVSSEESEQTLINHYFLTRWRPLSYTYNYAKHSVVSPSRHDIFVERYMDQIKVVHFLGVKPWFCTRERDCMRHVVYYTGATNTFLYDLWWSIFDDMCASENVKCIQAEPGKFLTELGLENSAPA